MPYDVIGDDEWTDDESPPPPPARRRPYTQLRQLPLGLQPGFNLRNRPGQRFNLQSQPTTSTTTTTKVSTYDIIGFLGGGGSNSNAFIGMSTSTTKKVYELKVVHLGGGRRFCHVLWGCASSAAARSNGRIRCRHGAPELRSVVYRVPLCRGDGPNERRLADASDLL